MRTLQQAHTYISLLWINMCIYGVPLSLSSDTFAYVSDKDDTVDNIIFAYYAYECHKFNCLYIYEAFLDWSYDSPNRQFSQSSRLLFVGNIEQKDIMKYTITAWTYTVNIQKIFGVCWEGIEPIWLCEQILCVRGVTVYLSPSPSFVSIIILLLGW